MIVKVHEHTIEIDKTPVNELEVNVTKMHFVFDETIPSNYVKKAFFTLGDTSIEILLTNDECDIPSEVLTKKGTVRVGVIAYEVQDETLIERYNPMPDYFETWEGSLIEADNTEPITPTDKEQIEALVQEVQAQMDNLDIETEKVEDTATITIIGKDGEVKTTVQIKDGEQGPQGEPGPAGQVKYQIVEELPETGSGDTLYFVPKEDPTTQNIYDEYAWLNNDWEFLGEKQIVVDLTDYVQFTDWAKSSKGGTIKSGYNGLQVDSSNGQVYCDTYTYSTYNGIDNKRFISKGTLEAVITGKGLVSNTDYATQSTGGVIKASANYQTNVTGAGELYAIVKNYTDYGNMWTNAFISKGTLDNVLNAKIGDIDSVLDAINGEVI